MKKIAFLTLALAVLAASCTKEQVYSCNPGDEVHFAAGSALGAQGTKTAYGSDGWSGEGDRRIDWQNDDLLCIACNQCENTKNAVYKAVNAQSNGQAGLELVSPAEGLRWGTGSHTFYAAYPSTSTIAESTGTLTATVAATQTGAASGSSSAYEVAPAMGDMILVSKKTIEPTDDGVTFDFTPLSTAIKMQITNNRGAAMRVASIALQSTVSQDLSGSFTANMSSWTQSFDPHSYPTCTASGSTSSTVTITTTDGTNSYLEVADNGTLTATFFLLPTADLYDLKFVITFSDSSTLSTVIKKTNGADDTANRITFPAHKKSYVTGVAVPTALYINEDIVESNGVW